VGRVRDRDGQTDRFEPSDEVMRIRSGLSHPVVDSDGHLVEFPPLIEDFLAEDADAEVMAVRSRLGVEA
jgi:hypothetical protein